MYSIMYNVCIILICLVCLCRYVYYRYVYYVCVETYPIYSTVGSIWSVLSSSLERTLSSSLERTR